MGTPNVTITVHMPMYRARSCWKYVSITTALPMAMAGEMKQATKARQAAIEA